MVRSTKWLTTCSAGPNSAGERDDTRRLPGTRPGACPIRMGVRPSTGQSMDRRVSRRQCRVRGAVGVGAGRGSIGFGAEHRAKPLRVASRSELFSGQLGEQLPTPFGVARQAQYVVTLCDQLAGGDEVALAAGRRVTDGGE